MIRNSRLPGLIGECGSNMNVLRALVNEAQERLMLDPLAPDEGWWGTWATMVFSVTAVNRQAYITTPREVARLTDIDVCGKPAFLRNGFYEYMRFGTGLRSGPPCCTQSCRPIEAFERDSVATLTELAGDRFIHVYATDTADIGQEVVIQGEDTNGNKVIELDAGTERGVEGEKVILTDPFVSTVNQFSTITGILKSATVGRVTFQQYDPVTATATDLSSMEGNETTAEYRRYFLSGLPKSCYAGAAGQTTVTAQAKLDLTPAMSDRDYLFIQNIPALIEEMQALRYGSMDSKSSSQKEVEHHTKALRLLHGQLDHYLGKVNTAISVPIFGSQRLTSSFR